MTKRETEEQIKVWKKELAIAMENEQWRLALKLCGWLRYALRQQELSDPKVEKAHRQAKEALAKQLASEKTYPKNTADNGIGRWGRLSPENGNRR